MQAESGGPAAGTQEGGIVNTEHPGAAGIAERLAGVMAAIGAACRRVGRSPDDVKICAVAKTFGPDAVADAARCGLTVIGENRVQEAQQKIPQCPGALEWHMVGHLQRNKVRAAAQLFGMVHSVDSPRVLDALSAACAEEGVSLPVCIEVNVSGESSKFGVPPADVPAMLERAAALPDVDVVGLMTIPPFKPEVEDVRPFFRALRELRDECGRQTAIELPELSMGMSHDFPVAIEEGATWIRLGTALFGERKSWAKQHTVDE